MIRNAYLLRRCRWHSTFDGNALQSYTLKKATPITVQQMIAMTSQKARIQVADKLVEELRIRVAHRIHDIETLPESLRKTPPVEHVTETYAGFFQELLDVEPIRTTEDHHHFCELISSIKTRDSRTLPAVAYGIREWKRKQHALDPTNFNLDIAEKMDRMFTARLSIRMLIGQHVEAAENGTGRIQRRLHVIDVAKEAASLAEQMCIDAFGVAPPVQWIECPATDKGVCMTYVRSHLHHILFELLKNSMRATVEQHLGEAGARTRAKLTMPKGMESQHGHHLPSIQVVVSGGEEDVTIKVSDLGGGVPRSDMSKIFSYQYSTAKSQQSLVFPQHSEFDTQMDLAYETFRENFYGLGYGLPIARVFSRYFGGDLNVYSTEGWGTDAYVHLKRLESAAIENIMVLPD